MAPEFRRRGHGWSIWQAGMARLTDRVVGLDGVVAEQAHYAKSSFVLAHRNIRHGGIVTAATGRPQTPIVDTASLPIERLIDYDARHFSSARPEFLRCWLRPDRRRGLLAPRDGEIAGLGVIRACRQGFKIGPLFADDARIADVLFVALAADANGAMVCLDVPQGNPAAMALAAQHGLRPAFEIARMYRCRAPDLPIERNFGITSFELG